MVNALKSSTENALNQGCSRVSEAMSHIDSELIKVFDMRRISEMPLKQVQRSIGLSHMNGFAPRT